MKIKSLFLTILCASAAINATETWDQWTRCNLVAASKGLGYLFGKFATRTRYVASKITTSPLAEKYKKQTPVVQAAIGGTTVASIAGFALYISYKWSQKCKENRNIQQRIEQENMQRDYEVLEHEYTTNSEKLKKTLIARLEYDQNHVPTKYDKLRKAEPDYDNYLNDYINLYNEQIQKELEKQAPNYSEIKKYESDIDDCIKRKREKKSLAKAKKLLGI